jgi:hypothetical protein
VEHGLPEGRIDKRYSNFPALAAITADKIRITGATAMHINTIFMNRLVSLGIGTGNIDENNIIKEITASIPRGFVLHIYPSDDTFNPLDKQIEIFTYFNIGTLIQNFDGEGTIKLKVLCRFSAVNGTLSLRTIQRNFLVD